VTESEEGFPPTPMPGSARQASVVRAGPSGTNRARSIALRGKLAAKAMPNEALLLTPKKGQVRASRLSAGWRCSRMRDPLDGNAG
jgi:hypothetical protein